MMRKKTAHEEVDRYMASVEDRKFETLDWWRQNASRYPRVAVLARKMLARPATSVPSERLFSIGGKIITADRSSLHPETVDKLLFLNSYLKVKEGGFAPELNNSKTKDVEDPKCGHVKVEQSDPDLPNLSDDTK